MIILEGTNGAGKSTLAKSIAKDLDFIVHKFTKIPTTRQEFWQQMSISKDLVTKATVQDRCPLVSDFIYAQYNQCRNPYVDKIEDLICYLKELNALLIFVDANHSKLKPKQTTDQKIQKSINNAYIHLFLKISKNKIPCLYYKYDHTDYFSFIKTLSSFKLGMGL